MSNRSPNSLPVGLNGSNGSSPKSDSGNSGARGILTSSPVEELLGPEDSDNRTGHLPTDLADWLHHDKKDAGKDAE
jgi:hypothetical protein